MNIEESVVETINQNAIPAEAGVVEETDQQDNRFTVFAVNCRWSKNERRRLTKMEKNAQLPEVVTFDVPENVLSQARKPKNNFENVIETYIYDSLSKKFGYELNYCQIYLPLDK